MPINPVYQAEFMEHTCYHITARAVGNQLLFLTDDQRDFFLYRYRCMLKGYISTLAYILVDNHVHFMVRVNPESDLKELLQKRPVHRLKAHQKLFLKGELPHAIELEMQFRDFFISYAMFFNRQYCRRGALFVNPYRRVTISKSSHYTQLVAYIHCNLVKHLGKRDYDTYPWSSYRDILYGSPWMSDSQEVLKWFGGKLSFQFFHKEQEKYYLGKWERSKARGAGDEKSTY